MNIDNTETDTDTDDMATVHSENQCRSQSGCCVKPFAHYNGYSIIVSIQICVTLRVHLY